MSEHGCGDFEFERKFFLSRVPDVAFSDPTPALILQAYLFAQDGYAVRVRVHGQAPPELAEPGSRAGQRPDLDALIAAVGGDAAGTMAAKGPAVGGTRYEAERELDPVVAGEIVRRADHVVAKLRYSVWLGEDGWVIDQFLGGNAPLVMAEVERVGPVTDLAIPQFCETELTDDDRFRNEHLANVPFGQWAQAYNRELALLGPRFIHSLGENRPG